MFPALATRKDHYLALAYVVRDRMLQRWISTIREYSADIWRVAPVPIRLLTEDEVKAGFLQ